MQYKIKEAREESGMSQAELAEKAKVARSIISGLESGRLKVTTTETLRKISEALGKKIDEIFYA